MNQPGVCARGDRRMGVDLGNRLDKRFGVAAGVVLCFAAALLLAGCGGSSGSSDAGLRAENEELRQENERLHAEVERLEGKVEGLRVAMSAGSEAEETGPAATEPSREETEPASPEPQRGSGGGSLAVAGSGDVSGEPLPELMPDDFPLPVGAVVGYVYKDYWTFNLDFVLDSEFEQAAAFYDEQLAAQGWEETGRTEGTVEGLKGVETTWERGTYIPEGGPQDGDYEQTRETMTLTVYEIEPSGVGVEIVWNNHELLDRNYEEE